MKVKFKKVKVSELVVVAFFMMLINALLGTLFGMFGITGVKTTLPIIVVCFTLIVVLFLEAAGKFKNRKKYQIFMSALLEALIILLLLKKELEISSLWVACVLALGMYYLIDKFAMKYAKKMSEKSFLILLCISFILLAVGTGSSMLFFSFIAVFAQTSLVYLYSSEYYKALERQTSNLDHSLKKLCIMMFVNLLFVHLHDFISLML